MPTKARQLASATISRRSRTGRRRLMSLHVRDVHYEVHARTPAIKFSASRAGGAASAPHALPALALAAVLAASCQYVPLEGSRCRTVRSRISRGLIGPHPVDAPNVPDAWPLGRLTSRPSARRARAALGERVAYDLMSCGLMSCAVLVSGHSCSCLATWLAPQLRWAAGHVEGATRHHYGGG